MSLFNLEIENGDNNTNRCDKKDEGDADKEDYHIFAHYFRIINLVSFPLNKPLFNIRQELKSNQTISEPEIYFVLLKLANQYRDPEFGLGLSFNKCSDSPTATTDPCHVKTIYIYNLYVCC